MPKFLVIQTSFIGDVVLTTSIIEKIHQYFPDSQIDFLLRKGNEGLLQQHPFINKVLIWDKKIQKKRNLFRMARVVRSEHYTHVINPHRFITSGFVTWFSGAPYKSGFDKNPFSFCYTRKMEHRYSPKGTDKPILETERYQTLIADITDRQVALPKLYPSAEDYGKIKPLQLQPYICIAPSSVWFTKIYPQDKWAELINSLPREYKVYILGGPPDNGIIANIFKNVTNNNVESLCGKLSYLQSAALMQGATMNYANDSGPLHFASALNAPVTGVFCSTARNYGFEPLSEGSKIVEIQEDLYCRPCGLHGHKACPEGHFRCALEIKNEQLLWWISKTT